MCSASGAAACWASSFAVSGAWRVPFVSCPVSLPWLSWADRPAVGLADELADGEEEWCGKPASFGSWIIVSECEAISAHF
ncbi:hypothetical protein PBS_05320 [Paraburkholderia sp. 2C]